MPRVAAWWILRSGSTTPLRLVDQAARTRELDDRDRALLRRLIGTEVRHRGTLRALVHRFARGKPKADLVAHLHVAMVQLLYLDRIPERAALGATAGAVRETLGPSKIRIVNAFLRALLSARVEGCSGDPRRDLVGRELHLAEPVFHDPAEHPHLWAEDALSIPAHLYKRWCRRLGAERAEALARTFLNEPALSLRCSADERDAIAAELARLDVPCTPGAHPRILTCPSACTAPVTGSTPFRDGRVSIQGESALCAAELLGAQAGERILDLCGAPGGKSAVLAGSGALVLACDADPRRLGRMPADMRRLRIGERVQALACDGAGALRADALFDGVLVDAPCTNTAVLGARPGARWRFGPGSLRALGELQQRLLRAGARRVREGGRLVWSTCSLEPEENSQRIRNFLDQEDGWELAHEHESLPDAQDGPLDGGYAALLRRVRAATR